MQRYGWRWQLAEVGLVVASLVVGGPTALAWANHFGHSQGCCYFADNANHTFFYDALSVANISAVDWARTNDLDPTHMYSTLQTGSYNSDTDVLVGDGNYTSGTYAPYAGYWQCTALLSDYATCGQGQLTINTRYGNATYGVACQEIGHSTGLDHSTNSASCMYNPTPPSRFDAHDVSHINGKY